MSRRISRFAGGSAVAALLSIAAMSGAAHAQSGPVASRDAAPAPSPSPADTSVYGDLDSEQVVDLFRNAMLCAGFRESDYSCSSIIWATTLDATVINYVEKAGWYIEPDIRANYRSGYDLSFDPEWEGISNFLSYSVSSRGVCDSTPAQYWTETTAVFSDGTNSAELQGDALAAYRTRMGENREPVTDHPCVRFERHAGARYDTVWKSSDDGSTVSYTVLPRDGHFVKYRLWNRDPISLRD